MGELPTRRRFTVDEYHRMGEAGILPQREPVELIAGEIVVREPIGSRHAGTVSRLNRLWTSRLGERAVVQIQNPIELPKEDSEPQPDVTLLRPRADFYTAAHPVAADVLLLIEVADSTLAVDRRVRMPLYARAAIHEAWLLDLTADRVEVYRAPTADGYQQLVRLQRGFCSADVSVPLEHHDEDARGPARLVERGVDRPLGRVLDLAPLHGPCALPLGHDDELAVQHVRELVGGGGVLLAPDPRREEELVDRHPVVVEEERLGDVLRPRVVAAGRDDRRGSKHRRGEGRRPSQGAVLWHRSPPLSGVETTKGGAGAALPSIARLASARGTGASRSASAAWSRARAQSCRAPAAARTARPPRPHGPRARRRPGCGAPRRSPSPGPPASRRRR